MVEGGASRLGAKQKQAGWMIGIIKANNDQIPPQDRFLAPAQIQTENSSMIYDDDFDIPETLGNMEVVVDRATPADVRHMLCEFLALARCVVCRSACPMCGSYLKLHSKGLISSFTSNAWTRSRPDDSSRRNESIPVPTIAASACGPTRGRRRTFLPRGIQGVAGQSWSSADQRDRRIIFTSRQNVDRLLGKPTARTRV